MPIVEQAVRSPERIGCVDVLRGFNMFWLAGGTGLALGLLPFCGSAVESALRPQFEHARWIGFYFYDFIFPLFIFVTGLSVALSMDRMLETRGLRGAYVRILRRTLLLFLLGVIYNGGVNHGWDTVRWMGVLQRIALCYGVSAVLYCHCNARGLVALAVAILVGYAALLGLVPVPGQSAVVWEHDTHWAAWVDQHLLPGSKHEKTWDANGLLGTVSAVSSCLMGVCAGILLKTGALRDPRKTLQLAGIGVALCAAALAGSLFIPIIKLIWTPTYALLAGGLSFLLLAAFHWLVDVRQPGSWTAPFLWIGTNAITIYLARNFMDFNALAERFTGGGVAQAVGPDGAYLLKVTVSLLFSLAFLRFLYNRRLFLRV